MVPYFKVLKFTFLIIFLLNFIGLKANDLPEGFTQKRVASNLDPTNIEQAPDGRLFLCLKNGEVRIIQDGDLLPEPFMDLSVDSRLERGLQGIVFHPDYEENNVFYAYYTVPPSNSSNIKTVNRLSKFVSGGDKVVPGSEEILFETDSLPYGYHNGGGLEFGKDGKLYVCTGEGGDLTASQSFSSLNGKVLRINPDGSIPEDNPFYNETTGKYKAIYAYGLRNPYQSSIDPLTGRIFIADVGASSWEEINEVEAGANYGWPSAEGPSSVSNFTNPVISYNHDEGCAVTGNTFYYNENSNFPEKYQNKYFYTDFCNGFVIVWDPLDGSETVFASGLQAPIDLEVASDGSLFYLTRGSYSQSAISSGELWQIKYVEENYPYIVSHPVDQLTSVGEDVTFNATANGGEPISYQWQKDGVNIEGATGISLKLNEIDESLNGSKYRVIISNSYSADTSDYAELVVSSRSLPVVEILEPADGVKYRAGEPIEFSGVAYGANGEELPPNWLNWKINFHHDNHAHPALELTMGESVTFTLDTIGETSDNVWLRVFLIARDFRSGGITKTVYKDIYPHKSEVTLATEPAGLEVMLDGKKVDAPYTFTGVEGVSRLIAPVTPKQVGDTQYIFSHWEHGNGETQFISTPKENTTYTAVYNFVTKDLNPFEDKISFYPNPADEYLNLKFNGGVSEDITVEIIDAMSNKQSVKKVSVAAGSNLVRIDVRNLVKGIYMVRINSSESSMTGKLFVK